MEWKNILYEMQLMYFCFNFILRSYMQYSSTHNVMLYQQLFPER